MADANQPGGQQSAPFDPIRNPMSLAQAADGLLEPDPAPEAEAAPKPEEQAAPEPEESKEQDVEATSESDEAVDEPEAEGEEPEATAEPEPEGEEVELPADWDDAKIAWFNDLDADQQDIVLKGVESAQPQTQAEPKGETKDVPERTEPQDDFQTALTTAQAIFDAKWSQVDLAKMAEDDPDQAFKLNLQKQQDQGALGQIAQRAEQQRAQYVQQELNTLVERNPELKDQETFTKVANDLRQYGRSLGYSDQRLAGMSAIDFEVLRDSMVKRQADAAARKVRLKGKRKDAAPKKPAAKAIRKTGKRATPAEKRAERAQDERKQLKGLRHAKDIAKFL